MVRYRCIVQSELSSSQRSPASLSSLPPSSTHHSPTTVASAGSNAEICARENTTPWPMGIIQFREQGAPAIRFRGGGAEPSPGSPSRARAISNRVLVTQLDQPGRRGGRPRMVVTCHLDGIFLFRFLFVSSLYLPASSSRSLCHQLAASARGVLAVAGRLKDGAPRLRRAGGSGARSHLLRCRFIDLKALSLFGISIHLPLSLICTEPW